MIESTASAIPSLKWQDVAVGVRVLCWTRPGFLEPARLPVRWAHLAVMSFSGLGNWRPGGPLDELPWPQAEYRVRPGERWSSALRGVEGSEAATDGSSRLVELVSFLDAPVSINAKWVTCEAGEDMQVNVENLLEGCFPVREEQVDALASQA